MAKIFSIASGVFLGALIVSTTLADGDFSAQRLLASWNDEDPGMRMVAEVIANIFASGFSWGGAIRIRESDPIAPHRISKGWANHERVTGVSQRQSDNGRPVLRPRNGGNTREAFHPPRDDDLVGCGRCLHLVFWLSLTA